MYLPGAVSSLTNASQAEPDSARWLTKTLTQGKRKTSAACEAC